jgi:hypothetical protein
MELLGLIGKTCIVGVSYFDPDGGLLKQTQFAGTVQRVDAEHGISMRLQHSDPTVAPGDFIVPPNLDAWFKAPPGHYRHAPSGVDIQDPDYLVTWDVHRSRETTPEGQHEWWDWVPNTQAPQVGTT